MPLSPPARLDRVDAAVPATARKVCKILSDAGFEAVCVGGAVRDALLDRPASDWDVASDAHPDQVIDLFRRTIPTGIQHGTVTVLMGKGDAREAIEVTTFRGEGAYSDGRRPDAVEFGVPLERDLARRDFTVNAIAYDPVAKRLVDPFDGIGDLLRRELRAVGEARERFDEDGLRVMRAVRFVAVLELTMEAETRAAISTALERLAGVSQERVRVELIKLLGARTPSLGLHIADDTGVLDVILPELGPRHGEVRGRIIAAIDALPPDPVLRLAAALGEVSADEADAALSRLRASNDERKRVAAARAHRDAEYAPAWSAGDVRRFVAAVGPASLADTFALRAAHRRAQGLGDEPEAAELRARAQTVVDAGDALTVGDLAIRGKQLMQELELAPGPQIGQLLRTLLERVLDDPALNERDTLVALARELSQPPAGSTGA